MEYPKVSIIIAAAEAGASLPATLDSIEGQDYPGVIEVIVAAADEPSRTAVTGRATIVDNPTGRTPTALNLAFAKSQGDVIVRVDAHALIPPDYVRRAVADLHDKGADNVGGMQVPVGDTRVGKAIAAAMASPFGAGDATYRIGGSEGPTDTVYLGTFRRETLEQLGGYDERFTRHQDYELNQRIRAGGGTVWFDPELRVEYMPRASFGALGRQYFDYGRWKRYFSSLYPRSLRLRQLAPPALVLGLATTLLAAIWVPWLALVPVAYVVVLAAVGLASLPRRGLPALLMPVALAIMHLAWGVGFLIGRREESDRS